MRNRLLIAAVVAACAVTGGCGTAAYQEAWRGCSELALSVFPRKVEWTRVPRTRTVTVREQKCAKPGDPLSCRMDDKYRTESYMSFEPVDRNETRRRARVDQCTRESCLQSHGNPDCES